MDISHGCYSGPIAQFDNVRVIWAQMAGYGYIDLRPQGGPVVPRLDFDQFTEKDMVGEWPDGAPDDPLIILLVHDERAGRIKWEHCPYIADRLEELEMRLMSGGVITTPAWLLLTQQFIRGLRTAAHYRQDVIFQ